MSWQADICRDSVEDFGCFVDLHDGSRSEPRRVRMVLRDGIRQGQLDSGAGMTRIMPQTMSNPGRRMGNGLLLAEDAPDTMSERIADLTVTDSLGRVWDVDQAQAVTGPDEEGRLVIVAWRLALRLRQDMRR